MKTFLNQKSWLFSLSLALLGSSTWTSLSAQNVDATKNEPKVITITKTLGEKNHFFEEEVTIKKPINRLHTEDNAPNPNKAQLGILMTDNNGSVVITKVFPNTAAELAGLQEGDKIIRINGKTTKATLDVQSVINSYLPGSMIDIQYERNGVLITKTATLKVAEKNHYLNQRTEFYTYRNNGQPAEDLSENACEKLDKLYGKAFLGVYLSHSYEENGTGAVITSIIPNTGADKAVIKAYDKFIKMNNQAIANTKEAIEFIASKKPGDRVRIHLIRDNKPMTIVATLGSWAENPKSAHRVRLLEEHCDRTSPEEPVNTEENTRSEISTSKMSMDNAITLEVFPNPTADFVTVKYNGEKAPLLIQIISLDGKEMFTNTIQNFNGTYNEQLSLSKYPAGIYLINLRQNDKQVSQQVVVQ